MNCKPGDLAIVVRDGEFLGKLVEVLYAAPQHTFRMPDGHLHVGCEPCEWLVKLVGFPVRAPLQDGGSRLTQYCAARDSSLRPLRGEPETEHVDDAVTA